MTGHAALQDTDARGPVSAAAAGLAARVLDNETSLDEVAARTAAHLLAHPRAEVVVMTLTSYTPSDEAAWRSLGGRAWVREWVREGSTLSVLPPPGAGPEAALTMPWLSGFARTGIVALPDRDALPAEAAQDRSELARLGMRSLLGTTYTADEVMVGSLSVAGTAAGDWPRELIDDLHLLRAAISARLTLERSRRAAAEALDSATEAQRAYHQFLASVGHELRTPLAAIVGYTEVLMDDAEQSPDAAMSASVLRDGPVVLRAADQLVKVVDRLLGAGRTLASDEDREDVDVAAALADVVHWQRTPARTAGVSIEVDVEPGLTVWSHAAGVRQVVSNLVGNAIAHNHPGGSVHVSTQSLLGESGLPMVRIVVRDDGPGMTAEQLEHAFEPFVRFAAPGTAGSGLGLALSRTFAGRDGGNVGVESTPGVGSAFWLELPARRPPGP
jgi:signal transduction histidine kinase